MADANQQQYNPNGPPQQPNPPQMTINQGAFPPAPVGLGPQRFQGPPRPMKGIQPGQGFPGMGPPLPNMRPPGNAPGLPPNAMVPPPMSRPGGPPQTMMGVPPTSYGGSAPSVNNGPGSNVNGFGGTPPPLVQNFNGNLHQGNRLPPPQNFSQPGGQGVNEPSQMSMASKNMGPPMGTMNATQPSSLPGGIPPQSNTFNNIRPPVGMMSTPSSGQGARPLMGGPPTSSNTSQKQPLLGPPLGPPTSSEMQGSVAERPGGLPVPFHGQGQYSHQVGMTLTPGTQNISEPTSRKSSRAPSPLGNQLYDAVEGQLSGIESNTQVPSIIGGPPTSMMAPSSLGSGPSRTFGMQSPSSGPTTMSGVPPRMSGGPPLMSGAPPPMLGAPPMSRALPPMSGTPPLMSGAPPPMLGAPSMSRAPPPMSGAPPLMSGAPPPISGAPPHMSGGPPRSMAGPPLPGGPGQMPSGGLPLQQIRGVNALAGPPLPQGNTNQMTQHIGHPVNNQNAQTAPSNSPYGQLPMQNQQPPQGQGYLGQSGGMSGPPRPGMPGQSQFPPGPGMGLPNSQGGSNQMAPPFGQPMGGPGGVGNPNAMNSGFEMLSLQDTGGKVVNLLQEKRLIPANGIETPKPKLSYDHKKANCNPDVFRCTLTSIPQSSSLLSKSRLPLGILIHPFKDLSQLPVIQSSVIVRCRSCRTYINPYVSFVDQRRWKCNLCYRINDLPDEFQFDPVSKTYGDPQRRPEIKSATIEFIAPSEYMLRPPQPAVYLYLLDVSFNAVETGYLRIFCQTLLDELDKIPKDSRTQVGFLVYDSSLHFFNLAAGQSQPQMLIVSDLEDVFLPCPDNLLVNLQESKELVIDLLNQLPNLFEGNMETGSALGPALQAAYKLMSSNGGRVTVMQTVLPTVGPGALQAREDSNQRTTKNVSNLGPATDFYKKLALDCSAQQTAVDLFMLNGQYADLATVSCISKYSGGTVEYYPSFHAVKNRSLADKFEEDLRRYFTRKIGFEAVMRIRCTKGLSIHTFHGNFFVRSTDLLSLPNINPDAGFGMQMSIEDSLTETSTACFQAALLYTSSKGERRIRVHTMCLPVTNQISEVIAGADQKAIINLLAKMGADRSVTSSMSDAREALINAAIDSLSSFGNTLPASQRMGCLPTSFSIRLLPTLVLALLKSSAFRHGVNTRLDDRVFALQQCKSLPLQYLLQTIYPDLYPVHNIDGCPVDVIDDEEIPNPVLLHLSSANVDRQGVYLLDAYDMMYLYVGSATSNQFCQDVFNAPNYQSIMDGLIDLPDLDNPVSEKLRNFVSFLMDKRPGGCSFLVIKEESKNRLTFFGYMIEDRTESTMSYYEFLQHIQKQVKS
ncbi:protein transport protein Sec24A-like isoform X2 [Mizuhopecten yessoensis]|uniref:Protein transport protein Sec24B n=1 Tax=Mizuhopecten yessoensis TaxID=6573 RepID=A0A210Q4D9_MIZYE|nr:protein transport protein Sec24A-like isoform X2 [Mizuhopecten yessoensis]OWF43608.1 Protein transport protein Sec24B [Mizuhopecten yessoensis]